MYEIVFSCSNCQAEIEAPSEMCGEKAVCPECGTEIVIPLGGIEKNLEIDGFILEEKLGSGGMGEVWLAEQISIKRKVALKILSPKYTSDQKFIERFMQEAKMVGKLEHPNIITAFAAGHVGNIYYLATSFVDGMELADRIKIDKFLPEREALKIIRAISCALKYAWDEHRILHRDIKPSNIMLDRKGVPRLMDLGISKSIHDDIGLTMDGLVVGTPYYMSPEQAKASPDIDFRADIYSLGATLYHMVAGVLPYDGDSAMAVIAKHLSEPLPLPEIHNTAISAACSDLIRIMMAKTPDERQSSWDYVIHDIDLVLSGKKPLGKIPDHKKEDEFFFAASAKKASRSDAAINIAGIKNTAVPVKKARHASEKTIQMIIHDTLTTPVVTTEFAAVSPLKKHASHPGSNQVAPPPVYEEHKAKKDHKFLYLIVAIIVLLIVIIALTGIILTHILGGAGQPAAAPVAVKAANFEKNISDKAVSLPVSPGKPEAGFPVRRENGIKTLPMPGLEP